MTGLQITDLLGHSIHHKEFQKILQILEITDRPIMNLINPHGIGIDRISFDTHISNEKLGISFDFTTYVGYKFDHEEPKSRYTNDNFEFILKEITFFNMELYPFEFPFDLKYKDSLEIICEKLGCKPSEKREGSDYRYAIWFIKEEYKLLIAIDENKQLLWLRLFQLESSEKKNIVLKKSLKEQNKNIKLDLIDEIKKQHSFFPTINWRKRMNDNDHSFTEITIKASEEILEDFINNILEATLEKKANKVFSSLKKAVLAFNKINSKYDCFIETLEREELVLFLENTIKLTGFKIEDGSDVTLEFRQW